MRLGAGQETQPSGETRTYLGVDVYEGHYDYRGMHIVPTWGGDMFEALMVPLFVPEERWGPRSWGVNHPLYVRAQIEHGLDEARYGYWGFSPSDNPSGGYSAYGVDAIGMDADGYPSNNDTTFVDHGFGDCRPAKPDPPPSPTPTASSRRTPRSWPCATRRARRSPTSRSCARTSASTARAASTTPSTSTDAARSPAPTSRSTRAWSWPAAANALSGDSLRSFFARGAIEQRIRPLLAMEQFTAG